MMALTSELPYAGPRLGLAARAAADPGLEAMLGMRSVAQGCSAALLVVSGGVLLGRLVA